MIRITDNLTRSERMAARKHNLNIAIKKMKKAEAKRPKAYLTAEGKREARVLIKAILTAKAS